MPRWEIVTKLQCLVWISREDSLTIDASRYKKIKLGDEGKVKVFSQECRRNYGRLDSLVERFERIGTYTYLHFPPFTIRRMVSTCGEILE